MRYFAGVVWRFGILLVFLQQILRHLSLDYVAQSKNA